MLRRTLRRLRFTLFALITTLIITLAVLIGFVQLAVPWLARNPERIEAFLTERLHQPVKIGHVDGAWLGGGPVLALEDVRIGDAKDDATPFHVPRAELAISFYAPFQHDRSWSEFRLVGVDAELTRDAAGWHLRGLDLAGAPASSSRQELSMGALGMLVLKDFKIGVDDPSTDLHLSLGASEIRVVNRGATTHLAGKVRNLSNDATALSTTTGSPATPQTASPIDLIADVDLNRRSGIFYAGGRDIDLARFVAHRALAGIDLVTCAGDAQIWIGLEAGHVESVRARVDVHDTVLAAHDPVALDGKVNVTPRARFDRLAFVARWLRDDDDGGWTTDVADFVVTRDATPTPPAELTLERRGNDDARYRAQATNIALEPIGNIAMLSSYTPPGLRRWLYLAHPEGQLAGADFRFAGAKDFDIDAVLHAAGFASANAVPGIDRLDAELHGDADGMLLTLPEQPLRVDYSHVFRKPFVFTKIGGDFVAYRTDDAWRLDTDRFVFDASSFAGEVRGGAEIQDDGSRPLLDLYALVTHADVTAAKLFWPTTTMAPQAISFLDRAIVGGTVQEGRVVVRGDLDSWPFRDNAGRFEARAHIVDTTFEYSNEWPRAEKLDAIANFVDDGMLVDVDSAEVKGNRVTSATGRIANFGDMVLELTAKGDGSGANLLEFLRATPIGREHEDVLKDLSIGGKGVLGFTLNLPIKDTSKSTLDGTVELGAANLDDAAFDLHFVDASGTLRFNQSGFMAGPLDVGFRQHPAKLSLAIGSYASDRANAVEARLTGRFPATTVFADMPDILPALARFPGDADWTAALSVASSTAPGGGTKKLTVTSDLRGIAIDLPPPLRKDANTPEAFRLALDLPFLGQNFTAKLGDIAAVEGRLPSPAKPFAARLTFGDAGSGALPERGLAIGGRVPTFDAGGWLDLVQPGGNDKGGGGPGLVQGIDLRIDDFTVADRSFGAMRLLVNDAQGATEVRLDGAALSGVLRVPASDFARQGVTARFDRFHWPESPPDAGDSAALPEVAPASLPPLHISVDDFMLGKASFGAAEFESHPIANGMRVDKLDSSSPNVKMSASGDWTGSAKSNESHLIITLTAQNLGHMMDALGFPGLIDGGQTTANIDALWPGPPSAFALPKLLTGAIELKVAEGRILEVQPGVGRIFGLLSLGEIPRRLSLDFTDIFKSGLGFNSITGTFGLDAGNAYTANLVIKSPAADILITGRTGLRAKDYDQEMLVTPHAGATLPLVGALAGGPVGAAAGLVLQGVLGKPLGKAAGSRYQVTGSWDKPQITLIGKDASRAPKTPPAVPEAAPAAPAETTPADGAAPRLR
jgi:uncharacterized protein (TIGR02099 family)